MGYRKKTGGDGIRDGFTKKLYTCITFSNNKNINKIKYKNKMFNQ